MHPLSEIFLTFARIGAVSFGGANFWLRRVLVEEKRWITDTEYLEGLAIGQMIPGPNVFNLTVMLGHRFGGFAGAFAAIGGLLGAPLVAVLALGIVYRHYSAAPIVQQVLNGMTPVAAGLVLANGVSLVAALPRRLRPWLFVVLAFVGVGVLHWPLVAVMAGLGPFAIAAVWREARAGKR